eukprot:scaffold149397_cov16-Tisochrysis_lutea.AAC.2
MLFVPQAKKREKEADERDRAKLKQKLEEDRKERRRKLGKPEELTEEEKVGNTKALPLLCRGNVVSVDPAFSLPAKSRVH